MPVLSSAAENWGLSFPEKGKTPVGNATSEELAAYNAWFAASPEENIIYLTFDCGYENGYTDAILDALKAVSIPAVEVHISDVDAREPFRQISYAGMACVKTIKGHGLDGYREAMLYLKERYG